jgi:adenosylcobinamide-phosphate synthase
LSIDAERLMRLSAGIAAVLTAFIVDHAFGEPPLRWHPVAWIGNALSATGAPWPKAAPSRAFVYGMLTWWAGAVISMLLAVALTELIGLAGATVIGAGAVAGAGSGAGAGLGAGPWPWLWRGLFQGVVLGSLLKPLLAWRMLHDEVASVEGALTSSLEAGREQLRRLVSRDTAALRAIEVRESALESLAENLNDSLVAPLFWFALGGLPGAALYRFANTADAMWGYRGRWEWSGKWAARADDVLSYLPARLTAALLAAVGPRLPRGLCREAKLTPSPNGGWPMAMLALALDIRLSKPGVYVLNAGGRAAAADDMTRGIAVASRAARAAVLLAGAAAGLMAGAAPPWLR